MDLKVRSVQVAHQIDHVEGRLTRGFENGEHVSNKKMGPNLD